MACPLPSSAARPSIMISSGPMFGRASLIGTSPQTVHHPARRSGALAYRATTGLALIKRRIRSEEHTSELQSLMRISYADFSLKKKKTEYITVKYIQSITNNNHHKHTQTR